MPKRKRKLIALLLTVIISVTAYFAWQKHRPHVSEVFSTQRPGEQKITWHTMETRWERGIFRKGAALNISDTKADKTSLYVTTEELISKVDKSSGNVTWKKSLNHPGESTNGEWRWGTTLVPTHLISTQIENDATSSSCEFRVQCIRTTDGKKLWEITADTTISSEPVVDGHRVLIPLTTGEVLCASLTSGAQLWRRQISTTHYRADKPHENPTLELAADNGICVARAGNRHFVGIDTSTGETLWSRTVYGSIRNAEQVSQNVVLFTLKGGILYMAASNAHIVAWAGATGKQMWRHRFNLPADVSTSAATDAPIVTKDVIIVDNGEHFSAVHLADGSLAWDHIKYSAGGKLDYAQTIYVDGSDPAADTFFTIGSADPVVNRSQVYSRSTNLTDVVAIDSATGKERWRWQNDALDNLQNLIPAGDSFYCDGGDRLLAIVPGPGEKLPMFKDGRRQLAYRMIEDLAKWNPTRISFLAGLMRRLSLLIGPPQSHLDPPLVHARLCLLNLHNDSIGPLLELVAHLIREIDSNKPVQMNGGDSPAWELDEPLNLLYDIRAYSAIPQLIKDMQSTRSPDARRKIAELLIRFNRSKAMPALYTYAKACPDAESVGGEETLSYLCRFAPAGRSADKLMPTQENITEYLSANFVDPRAPKWFHRLAQFELLRGRGEAASTLVKSHIPIEAKSRLMPTIAELMGSDDFARWNSHNTGRFVPMAQARGSAGRWWGVFECGYFGQVDLWVVQSSDGKSWMRPTVAIPGLYTGNGLKLKVESVDGLPTLKLSWNADSKHRKSQEISASAPFKDSDGDGIPDIVEREIGTNPQRADSHGVGLRDGDNKNPLYFPHRLSEKEQIYQAVMEASCRYSLYLQSANSADPWWAGYGPVDPDMPLVFPAGPAGAVPIFSHRHTVLMYPPSDHEKFAWSDWNAISFANPLVGFDGKISPRDSGEYDEVHRLYRIRKPQNGIISFSERFPYQQSADKTRVRIGVCRLGAEFDVEVDKIGGKWLPVGCQRMSQESRHDQWEAAVPARDE